MMDEIGRSMNPMTSQLLLWASLFIWTIFVPSTSMAKEPNSIRNPQSAIGIIRNLQSEIRNPQSEIGTIYNPQSLVPTKWMRHRDEFRLISKLETRRPASGCSELETYKRDRFLTATMVLLGTSGIVHLMADSSYQGYEGARDKATAEKERDNTKLLDNTRNTLFGIAGVCIAVFEYRSYTTSGNTSLELMRIDGRSLRLTWMW